MTNKLKVQPQGYSLRGRDGEPHNFTGVVLGFSTSRAKHHTHPGSSYARRSEKCSACRWFEVAIYRRYTETRKPTALDYEGTEIYDVSADYVVHTVGGSVVPGERRLSRVEYTTSGYEVVELLTVRPLNREPYISNPSLRALAQASDVDDGIRDAYVNRAVV